MTACVSGSRSAVTAGSMKWLMAGKWLQKSNVQGVASSKRVSFTVCAALATCATTIKNVPPRPSRDVRGAA
jgi:hypothetical protein